MARRQPRLLPRRIEQHKSSLDSLHLSTIQKQENEPAIPIDKDSDKLEVNSTIDTRERRAQPGEKLAALNRLGVFWRQDIILEKLVRPSRALFRFLVEWDHVINHSLEVRWYPSYAIHLGLLCGAQISDGRLLNSLASQSSEQQAGLGECRPGWMNNFFSRVCLMASMARSVNCLGQKNAVQVHLIGAKPIVQVKRWNER